jgi:lipid-binding SYLF domain-containing protein
VKFTVAVRCLLAMATTTLAPWDKSPEQKREEIRQMKNATLAERYKLRPETANLIKGAEGFAAFSSKGMKIMVAGTTLGKGVLVDRKTGQKTHMKMAQVNVGLGFGLQAARLVFRDRKAMEEFTTQG